MRLLPSVLFAAFGLACGPRDVAIDPAQLAAFAPLPAALPSASNPATPAKVELGWRLYYETRLSADGTHSCNSCHRLDAYGVDGLPVSIGVAGAKGRRNAPTVYNAAGHLAQYWDGRAASVEEQAKGPILDPSEMAIPSAAEAVARIARIPEYRQAFAAAFPDDPQPVTYDNLARAIGAFERQLLTPARWDQYLQGDADALTVGEKRGLKEFLAAGCQECHDGPFLGGGTLERVGAVRPWPSTADPGRAGVTGVPADSLVFKVPGLRNVAQTAPYFNDGQTPSLDVGVRLMARHQLGLELSDRQITSILAFLGALTGELPSAYVSAPPTMAGGGS